MRATNPHIATVKAALAKINASEAYKKKLQSDSVLTDEDFRSAIEHIERKGFRPIRFYSGKTRNSLWIYGGKPINKSAI